MKKYLTRTIRILGLLLIFWGGLILLLPLLLPQLMVSAPNGWSEIDTTQDPGPEELARLGVDLHLRVHAGPPDVSLSSFVINPDQPEPRGTILLLHGHRDNKLSQLEFGRWVAGQGTGLCWSIIAVMGSLPVNTSASVSTNPATWWCCSIRCRHKDFFGNRSV